MSAPTGTTADLFARIVVVDQWSLGERLQQQDIDADLLCAGDFPRYVDRLRHVITVEQLATVVCGCGPDGKGVETFEQAFERVCFEPLVAKRVRKSAPRGTTNVTSQTSKATS